MRRHRDGGFTLIELLIVISMISILAVALTEASIIGWRTTSATTSTFASSHDAQTFETFWSPDVQSAQVVDTSAADTRCLQSGDTLVVRFTGATTDASLVQTTFVEAYVQRLTGTETQVIRRACSGPYGGPLTSTNDVIVVHGLGNPALAPAPAAPTLSCAPSCSAARTVTLSVVEQNGYSFAVTARRRAQ